MVVSWYSVFGRKDLPQIIFSKVTLQGKFRIWDSKFREMKNRSVESVEKDRRLFHPSHSQNDDGDNE